MKHVTDLKIPKWFYHPTADPIFVTEENLEWFKTLDNIDEWEDLPFTGERKYVEPKKKCPACIEKSIKINELQTKILELEASRPGRKKKEE